MATRYLVKLAIVLVGVIATAAITRAGTDSDRARPEPFRFARPADAAPGSTYRFDPRVTEINRRAFLAAAGRVRPEATRLFERVAGLVTVVDAVPPAGTLGVTIPRPGGYEIRFAFGDVFARLGQRGFDRLVQHELAHVVDAAMVPDELRDRLDTGIPPGLPCQAGTRTGSCAPTVERFAESFAKWASGDLGINLYAGYAVPPPPDLEAWGRPLAELAG